jgi:hypothetical protein
MRRSPSLCPGSATCRRRSPTRRPHDSDPPGDHDSWSRGLAPVYRIMFERGLVHPARYQGERRELAKARRAVFHDPPTRRNRVWHTDFSELETRAGGVWQMGGVVDYVSKFCLTCPVTATKTWREAVACLEAARERASEALGYPLIQDLVDTESGELRPVTVVTDNGPCYRARGFRAYIASRPGPRCHPAAHGRTCHPQGGPTAPSAQRLTTRPAPLPTSWQLPHTINSPIPPKNLTRDSEPFTGLAELPRCPGLRPEPVAPWCAALQHQICFIRHVSLIRGAIRRSRASRRTRSERRAGSEPRCSTAADGPLPRRGTADCEST